MQKNLLLGDCVAVVALFPFNPRPQNIGFQPICRARAFGFADVYLFKHRAELLHNRVKRAAMKVLISNAPFGLQMILRKSEPAQICSMRAASAKRYPR